VAAATVEQLVGIVAVAAAAMTAVGQDNRDFGQLSTKALPVVLHQALYLSSSISVSSAFRIAP